MLPQVHRLWLEPAPNTKWTSRDGTEEVWVWYVTGNEESRFVVLCRRFTGVDDMGMSNWSREALVPLRLWRREWVWMREVAE